MKNTEAWWMAYLAAISGSAHNTDLHVDADITERSARIAKNARVLADLAAADLEKYESTSSLPPPDR